MSAAGIPYCAPCCDEDSDFLCLECVADFYGTQQCIKCEHGSLQDDGTCSSSCTNSTLSASGECTGCPPGCLTCTSNQCIECAPGYDRQFNSGLAYCVIGSKTASCGSGCSDCFNGYCFSCDAGLTLEQDYGKVLCVSTCPPGFY